MNINRFKNQVRQNLTMSPPFNLPKNAPKNVPKAKPKPRKSFKNVSKNVSKKVSKKMSNLKKVSKNVSKNVSKKMSNLKKVSKNVSKKVSKNVSKLQKKLQPPSPWLDIVYAILFVSLFGLLGYLLYMVIDNSTTQPVQIIPNGAISDKISYESAGGQSSYPNIYSPDEGVSKAYYINTREQKKLNEYIRTQNNYIRQVNNRVHQINDTRMYDPSYMRDQATLHELREYERKLANKVVVEGKNQPYLSDQVMM